jgi:hypothetical protein
MGFSVCKKTFGPTVQAGERKMTSLDKDKLAKLEFELDWKSSVASHKEVYHSDQVNLWRDVFPQRVGDGLIGRKPGETLSVSLTPGEVIPNRDGSKVLELESGQFERKKINGHEIEPRYGRFYPKGLLKNVAGIFSANIELFHPKSCCDVMLLP